MRILIIDDDFEIRGFLRNGLEADGFAVDTSGNGEDGSFMARTREYDLILLDSILPVKLGKDVCREIRQSGKKTPIIILSVVDCIDSKVCLLDHGADDYLTKPFLFDELRARIRALLRRPTEITKPILRAGDFILNSRDHTARRGRRDIYLTRKEFALTEYLMRNKGTVVSRAVLMDHVWNESVDPFSNTVEVHILNIRKKIDAKGCKKLIHTVTGCGYKIDVQHSIFT